MSDFKVAVIGCGLGGAAVAIAIQKAGHQVTVFEQAEELHEVCPPLTLPVELSNTQKFVVGWCWYSASVQLHPDTKTVGASC